jgi:hypothetical protein
VKLFDGVPDPARTASDSGLDRLTTEQVLLELAWITKTISRIGKGYVLGSGAFSRPGSEADQEYAASAQMGDEFELPEDSAWVMEDEIGFALADRTGLGEEEASAVVTSVAQQVDEHGGGLRTAMKLLEVERVVEDQLMDDPSVLAIWGWGLSDVRRQVRLSDSSRADLVGRRDDGTLVVVELKRGAALLDSAEQVLRYLPLAQEKFGRAEPAVGLVIADGDDDEFHEFAAGVQESISYLPVRCLDLPACRPQQHRVETPAGEAGRLTVAADGITVVGAVPGVESFGLSGPRDLRVAGRRLLDGDHTPVPIARLGP